MVMTVSCAHDSDKDDTMSAAREGSGLMSAAILAALLLLGACSHHKKPAPVTQNSGAQGNRQESSVLAKTGHAVASAGKSTGKAVARTGKGTPGALASPLVDLNIKKPVPPDTLENLGYVYTVSRGLDCEEIARQVAILDAALAEPDTDILAAEQIIEENKPVSTTALDLIGSVARSIIPLRPVVRTATGARRAKKHYNERFDNGRRRRAFLKGYGLAKGCKPPAAPLLTYAPDWGKKTIKKTKKERTPRAKNKN